MLVLADGQIIEDGDPATLLAQTNSAYARMIAEERALQQRLRDGPGWQRYKFRNGGVYPQ